MSLTEKDCGQLEKKFFKNPLTIAHKCDIIISEREVIQMKKFKISIEKFFEEEIEATTEEEAVDKAWQEWEKENVEVYIDEVKD